MAARREEVPIASAGRAFGKQIGWKIGCNVQKNWVQHVPKLGAAPKKIGRNTPKNWVQCPKKLGATCPKIGRTVSKNWVQLLMKLGAKQSRTIFYGQDLKKENWARPKLVSRKQRGVIGERVEMQWRHVAASPGRGGGMRRHP